MIYEPSDDSFLLNEVLEKNLKDKSLKILEIGVGSGFILERLGARGFENLEGVDINSEAVDFCRKKGFEVWKSDLFSEVKEKYDVIIFNPPYLPKDSGEDLDSELITSGGTEGSELTNKFLKEAKKHLEKEGKVYLIVSSLAKGLDFSGFEKEILGQKRLFFEVLTVLRLTKN